MKNSLLYFGILIYLLLTQSTANSLGINEVGLSSSGLLICILFCRFTINKERFYSKSFKEEYYVLLSCFLILLFKLILNDYESLRNTIFYMLVPVLISILVHTQNNSVKLRIQNLMVFFYLSECILSIYERLYETNFFPYEEFDSFSNINNESWMFRSSAFLGHPLTNAVAVSTILAFIVIGNFTSVFKIISMTIGFVSLLCFNARGAIIIWSILIFLYIYIYIKNYNRNFLYQLFSSIIIISIVTFIHYLVFDTSLGGRIINQKEILDGSAQTRLDVYGAFNYISSMDLLLGNSNNYKIVMSKLGASGIENSFIVIIIRFGLIMGFILMLSLFFLVKKLTRSYTKAQKLIVLSSFLLVGSFNNALSAPIPWIVYLLCSNTFFRHRKVTINKSSYNSRLSFAKFQ